MTTSAMLQTTETNREADGERGKKAFTNVRSSEAFISRSAKKSRGWRKKESEGGKTFSPEKSGGDKNSE